uniref:Protein FAR1-RELATED SEQUENCE n=1 Tax=Fagus sylvatica TaxID=28930 RepID=A0A2N9H080_FAGSY
MDGVRSFGASNSFVEDLPQPVEGNMQDTPESVRNSMIEPRVGMEFDSLQQVIEFYKHYAYSKGFATMTRNSRKNKGFSETSYVNLKCNREGRYSSSVDDPSKKSLLGLEAYQDIKHSLLKAVHDSMTVEEFEEKWNHTITLHHLEENEWLAKLYEERERWVPAFLNSNFFAGMSNLRSNAMRNKVKKEILSDFECFKGKLEYSSSSPMEKQFQEAYTHESFKRVRLEFAWETRHALFVLSQERVTVLPDRYILDRWRKDIKRKHTYVSTCTDDVQHNNPVLERYEKLHRLAVGVLEIGAESVENFNVLEKLLIDLKDNFSRSCDKHRKGRPRMKRLKSLMEEAVSKPKKKRNTATARSLAHSTSTTGVGGSAYGDGSTSNMSLCHRLKLMEDEDQALNLT